MYSVIDNPLSTFPLQLHRCTFFTCFCFHTYENIKISILGEIGRRKDAKKFQMVSPLLLYMIIIIYILYKYLSIIGLKKVKNRFTISLRSKKNDEVCNTTALIQEKARETNIKLLTRAFPFIHSISHCPNIRE
jgi:hypothetical protein